jgi:hypothetical protein
MFWKNAKRKKADTIGLFNGHYIDVKVLYVMEFDKIPCLAFIGEIDTSRALAYINAKFATDLISTFQHNFFDHTQDALFFNNTIIVLDGQRMIELGNNYVQILYRPGDFSWADALVKEMVEFKTVQPETSIGFTRQTTMN